MDNGFAMTPRRVRLMVVGLVVLVAGFILLAGGGVEDPKVFNYDMFDFQRLVLAPIVMVCGIIIELVAILRKDRDK